MAFRGVRVELADSVLGVGPWVRGVLVDKVIVEFKTTDNLSKAHYAQVCPHLRATGLPVALLVDFAKEKADFRRVEKP